MITSLTPEDVEAIRAGLVAALLRDHREDLELLSPAQVAGILDVQVAYLKTLPIPRITITPGKIYRYRLADVKAWLAENRA
jgi:hypothetical protein